MLDLRIQSTSITTNKILYSCQQQQCPQNDDDDDDDKEEEKYYIFTHAHK